MPLILLLVAGQRYPVARFHIGQDTATGSAVDLPASWEVVPNGTKVWQGR